MIRPVTLFTGQFADIPIKELAPKAAKWGYEGLELACWGDHLNVDLAAKDMNYVKTHLKMYTLHQSSEMKPAKNSVNP